MQVVCRCGYVQCWVCRKAIGSAEGYQHFCQHFLAVSLLFVLSLLLLNP